MVNNKDYQKGGCLDTPLDPPLYIIDSTLPATADCSVILMVAQSSGLQASCPLSGAKLLSVVALIAAIDCRGQCRNDGVAAASSDGGPHWW